VARTGVVVRDGVVENIVVWSDYTADQLAEQGVQHCQEVTDMVPRPGVRWTWSESDGFRPPAPYASWVWGAEEMSWIPPIPAPEDGDFEWDDEGGDWVEAPVAETPSIQTLDDVLEHYGEMLPPDVRAVLEREAERERQG
jgi:hypothetical protein